MLTQVKPPLPLETSKGPGWAHFVIDYGPESALLLLVEPDRSSRVLSVKPREEKMSQNLWDKAAACALAAEAASDPKKREILLYLGAFWVSLANAHPAHLDGDISRQIADIDRMQAELIGTDATSH
jgi:hypothetical protein